MNYLITIVLIIFPLLTYSAELNNHSIEQTTNFKCTFSKGVFTVWKDNKYQTDHTKGFDKDEIFFDIISKQDHTAKMIGNQGTTGVKWLATSGGITFLEETSGGNFIMTTIFFNAVEKNKFLAVMSRHLYTTILNSPLISQNFGFCEALN